MQPEVQVGRLVVLPDEWLRERSQVEFAGEHPSAVEVSRHRLAVGSPENGVGVGEHLTVEQGDVADTSRHLEVFVELDWLVLAAVLVVVPYLGVLDGAEPLEERGLDVVVAGERLDAPAPVLAAVEAEDVLVGGGDLPMVHVRVALAATAKTPGIGAA